MYLRRAMRAALLVPAGAAAWALAPAAQLGARAVLGAGINTVIHVDHGPNAPAQQRKPYVVLVSIDGLRWDMAKKDDARHILTLAAHGASAPQGMIPSYPSLTVPNQYTLVTGLYPEHHGMVADSFYNADHTRKYSLGDRAAATDASWYGGTPLWVLAEQQGMRSACLFWTGCEAPIDGVRPTYSLQDEEKYPDAKRVDQVAAWLRRPAAERPHLITLHFPDVDHAGREHGPDAPQTAGALGRVDEQIGRLEEGIAKTHLPVDLIVLSDHGMITAQGQPGKPWIDLDKYADLSHFKTAGSLLYADHKADAAQAYEQLKIADARFTVYRRADVPKELHYNSSARIGDPVIIATVPVAIRGPSPVAGQSNSAAEKGLYGLNPYPFIAELLGLAHPPVDGSVNILAPALKDHPPN